LPGIGRKSANVLLISAFEKPGITVDTHCKRLSQRLGFTTNDNPDKIEFDLKDLYPEKDWCDFSHCIIWHGRRRCHARSPMCDTCEVARYCPSKGQV
ncbi:MAG: endonuclease III, partial [Verrucomicrobiota bacterium]